MPSNYWSCSKFADWIRGTPKLRAGTSKEWNTWEKFARKKSFRYWLAEEGLDHIQNFINWPKNRLDDVRHYCDNRWISKSHSLNSRLKIGQWHDFDTRMLHSAFDSLVDFVEIEKAWLNVICSDEVYKKYRGPWYRRFFRIRRWRSPEAGLEHLEWAASLKFDEDWIDKNDPDFGKLTPQAIAAQETMVLYKWWKEVRPDRPDPMDASGLSDHYEKRRLAAQARGDDLWIGCDEDEPDREHLNQLSKECQMMEQEQVEEDTEMLIRLVKIRGSLWT